MILREMMLEVVIGVMVMEVDKVADEVTNMEVDKVTNMMAEYALMKMAPPSSKISN